MGKRLFARHLFLMGLFFCLAAFPVFAQENEDENPPAQPQKFFDKLTWYIEGSVLFFPENNGMYSDPMPVLPSLGAGVSYPFTNIFSLDLTLDYYMTHYGYSYVLDRAVPQAMENRSSRVIGLLFAIEAAAYFSITPLFSVRVYGGPAADFRIVLLAAGLNDADLEDASKQTDSVRKYFWSSGRWFMPVIGTGFDFTVNSRFAIGIDLRVWMPAYRIWTGEDLPAIEGWRFDPGIRFTIRK